MSLVEVLLSAAILTISMAVLSELAVLIIAAVMNTTNKVTGMEAARAAMNRISSDVRQARTIGDFYGVAATKLSFPSTTNPQYGTTPPPLPAGWQPMKVSGTVLVLQIPVTYEDPDDNKNPANGLPIMLPKDHFGTNLPPVNTENLDTVVYEVVPDQERLGEYMLQFVRYPGAQLSQLPSVSTRSVTTPQTILKGLVGPIADKDGLTPSVFSYLAPQNAALPYAKTSNPPTDAELIRGVGIDLEIKNTGRSATEGDGRFSQHLGIHTEAFLRTNASITVRNTLVLPP
jgi:type II secretory pathway pseudopilin PulG